MSDPKSPESAEPAASAPVADPAAPPPAEPVATTTPAAPAETVPAADPTPPAVATTAPVVERKKRGVGIWSFVLGLLTILGDAGYVVLLIAMFAGTISSIGSGDVEVAGTLVVLGILGPIVYFGGFVVAGIGALLGVIALIAGRGRVLGFFGLVFSAIGILVRVLIATGALSGVESLTSGIGG